MPRPPLISPNLPAYRRTGVLRDERQRWAIIGSVLLHLLALAALLITRRPEPPLPVAPSYDLIFENGGSSTPPTAPERALDIPSDAPAADLPPTPLPEPPAPASVPESPIMPETPPSEPPTAVLPAPEPPPEPEAEPESAPETTPARPPQALAEPTPEPSPEPPAVRLVEPEPATPPLSPQTLAPDLPPLTAPPPLPPAPTPPRPRPQAQQRLAPGAFPPPIDLNFGRAASRAPMPRLPGSSHAIDLSLGAPKPGPNKSEAFFDIRAANIGADWAQGLAAYWRRHRYYPPQAAQNGEDGTVEIQIVVNRQGRVESVEIQRRSGSPWLDMAAVGTWRNAQLEPLPAENTDRTITIPLTINYLLIR